MNNLKRLSDEECQNIRDQLFLKLNSDEAPFALNKDEEKFGPDDWAWLFLRMNKKYQFAYSNHPKAMNKLKILEFVHEKDLCNIHADLDERCRRSFGLAAWLDYAQPILPELKNEGDSWFAPLKAAIPEDHSRRTVSKEIYIRPLGPQSRKLDRYPYHLIEETPFGYRIRGLPFTSGHGIRDDLGCIAFAVDCSVPPSGQITTLKKIAHKIRSILMDSNELTDTELNETMILEIKNSENFNYMNFKIAGGAEDIVRDYEIVWRAVYLNVLGPITMQIEKILGEVKDVYQELQDDGFAKPSSLLRFKYNLVNSKDLDGLSRNGGNYLKCLVLIAQLHDQGFGNNQIAQIFDLCSETGKYKNTWREQLHNKIDEYIVEAKDMINGGYRLLIQTQKPDQNLS